MFIDTVLGDWFIHNFHISAVPPFLPFFLFFFLCAGCPSSPSPLYGIRSFWSSTIFSLFPLSFVKIYWFQLSSLTYIQATYRLAEIEQWQSHPTSLEKILLGAVYPSQRSWLLFFIKHASSVLYTAVVDWRNESWQLPKPCQNIPQNYHWNLSVYTYRCVSKHTAHLNLFHNCKYCSS